MQNLKVVKLFKQIFLNGLSEAKPGPPQTFKMKSFPTIANG